MKAPDLQQQHMTPTSSHRPMMNKHESLMFQITPVQVEEQDKVVEQVNK